MSRLDALLFFLTFTAGAFASSPYNSRQFFENHIYLPRCRFDEHILKNDEKFNKEIYRSDFVFTGKVSSSEILYRDNAIMFSVTVRRYFKNTIKFPKNKEVRILKTLNEGEGVKCRQPIRPKFTAIFIGRRLKNSKDADIFLGIGPVPVTLYNLDRVSAATKGRIFITFIFMKTHMLYLLGMGKFSFFIWFHYFFVFLSCRPLKNN